MFNGVNKNVQSIVRVVKDWALNALLRGQLITADRAGPVPTTAHSVELKVVPIAEN